MSMLWADALAAFLVRTWRNIALTSAKCAPSCFHNDLAVLVPVADRTSAGSPASVPSKDTVPIMVRLLMKSSAKEFLPKPSFQKLPKKFGLSACWPRFHRSWSSTTSSLGLNSSCYRNVFSAHPGGAANAIVDVPRLKLKRSAPGGWKVNATCSSGQG